jgi:phosphoglycerate kinase
MVAIVGGSKVSTKLTVLEALSEKVDQTGGRRRHRQHLPQGHRQERRQVAVRGRPGAHRPGADEEDDRARRDHPDRVDVVCGKKFDAAEPAVQPRTPVPSPTTT